MFTADSDDLVMMRSPAGGPVPGTACVYYQWSGDGWGSDMEFPSNMGILDNTKLSDSPRVWSKPMYIFSQNGVRVYN